MHHTLTIQSTHAGLHEITEEVISIINRSAFKNGLCTIFIQHTSASLLIQENADPTARQDLERWLNRLVPFNDPLYQHTLEGPDDMPAHIKAALTPTSLSIPVINGNLALGTWQGIYLWEHRARSHQRSIIITLH